jgi:hypothetical protein
LKRTLLLFVPPQFHVGVTVLPFVYVMVALHPPLVSVQFQRVIPVSVLMMGPAQQPPETLTLWTPA